MRLLPSAIAVALAMSAGLAHAVCSTNEVEHSFTEVECKDGMDPVGVLAKQGVQNVTVIVRNDGGIETGGDAIRLNGGSKVDISGYVSSGSGIGVRLSGDGPQQVTINGSGQLLARTYGIFAPAGGEDGYVTITNFGLIGGPLNTGAIYASATRRGLIQNFGEIAVSGSGYGINLVGSSGADLLRVISSGPILAGSFGIRVQGSQQLRIDSSASVNAGGTALEARYGDDIEIINSGNLTVRTGSGYGIYADGVSLLRQGPTVVKVTNTGDIVLGAETYQARGITAYAASGLHPDGWRWRGETTVVNHGNVTGLGSYGIGIESRGTDLASLVNTGTVSVLGGTGLSVAGALAQLNNNASITGGSGIFITGGYYSGEYGRVELINSGDITALQYGGVLARGRLIEINNSGGITAPRAGLEVAASTGNQGGLIDVDIVNRGRSVSSRAFNGSAGNDHLINAGVIRTNSTSDSVGAVNLAGGDDIMEMIGLSEIHGRVDGGIGTDTLRWGGDVIGRFDMGLVGDQFINFEQFEKTGSSIWIYDGVSTAIDHLQVREGEARIQGQLVADATVSAGAILGGTGAIDGHVTIHDAGIYSPGASIGSQTVQNFTMLGNDATFRLELEGGHSDHVTVTETAAVDGLLEILFLDTSGFDVGWSAFFLTAAELNGEFDRYRVVGLEGNAEFSLFTEDNRLGLTLTALDLTAAPPVDPAPGPDPAPDPAPEPDQNPKPEPGPNPEPGPGPNPENPSASANRTPETVRSLVRSVTETGRLAVQSVANVPGLALFGAHHRSILDSGLPRSASDGACAWATADAARNDDSRTRMELAEIGVCKDIGPTRIGIGIGSARARQDWSHGGQAKYRGQYIIAEAAGELHNGLQPSVTAYYGRFDADLRRQYRDGETIERSHGTPDAHSYALRLRLDWKDAAQIGQTRLSPYAAYTYMRTRMEGYTETGGSLPAQFNSRRSTTRDVRVGAAATSPLGSSTDLRLGLEVVHRRDDTSSSSGSVSELFDFKVNGEKTRRNWTRATLDVDHRISQNALFTVGATAATKGGDSSWGGTIGVRMSF